MLDVLFVSSEERRELHSLSNGTLLLGTKLLQADISVQVVRFAQYKNYNQAYTAFIDEIVEDILYREPRCVSFYTLWPYYHIMLRIAAELKSHRAEINIILGGPQASATAKTTMEAMPFVDYICTGEGENTVVPFFKALLQQDTSAMKAVPGVYHREGNTICCNEGEITLCDLDSLPRWDDSLYMDYIHDTPEQLSSNTYFMPIDPGRGCPFSCTFCCSSGFWRRTYRLKSPERILDDIRFYHEKFGIKSFGFTHDAFTINKKKVEAVCDKLIESGLQIKWRCTTRIDCITEDLILKMKQAGLTHIELGVETGSVRMQKLINKKLKLDQVQQMVRFLLKNKIHVALYFMYGFPEETEEDLQQTLQMLFSVLDMGVNFASLFFCQFLPTTAITERFFDQLVIKPEMTVLTDNLSFGYEQELPIFQANKRMFPFAYHLDTPVRNNYQYATYLAYLYRKFPVSAKYVRGLFAGDDLKFYRTFYEHNRHYFDQPFDQIPGFVKSNMLNLWYGMIEPMHLPYEQQLKALLKFDCNIQQIAASGENTAITETYGFSYVDFKMKLPLEQYSAGKTEILLEKVNGKMSMKILKISYDD